MEFETVSWIAVITGAVAAFLFGWLVYSPLLFFKVWAEGSGVEVEPGGKPPLGAMVLQIIGLLCLSAVVGVTATIEALITALLAILAAACLTMSNGAFAGKSTAAIAVDGGYIVGAGILMIVAQAIY
ncbi:DUF1761 family protein [Roseibium sediminicola]|uniref:DUF1761 family protein n=1 Tax=Roseibium sediminicola TaxID=2933272 RepID=A0ABT0GU09_9HYPH|nr:DUF1761 family protein [Roseibium sp. CAU 1639]MCK7612776.1 DUF1761 family protein [Roseibium sp. CAU 1639]